MRLPPKAEDAPHYRRLRYRLDCGREVEVEGFYVSPSTIGYLEGSKEYIRDPIIKSSPKEPANNFPESTVFSSDLYQRANCLSIRSWSI